jgi:membrane-bound lytic murein transglycosylase B
MFLIFLKTRRRIGMSLLMVLLCLSPVWADESENFKIWRGALMEEALARGISQATVDKTLKNIEFIPRVIELDRYQPESVLSLNAYLNIVASETRVQEGREKWQEYYSLLDRVGQQYGVQPRFLVALWGVETRYGQLNGRYPVVSSLATLAYNGRRSAFFRRELFEVLRLIDQGHLAPEELNGSWAGALGLFQFMPSSIRRFGIDFDRDGRIDLAKTYADAFASAANYLVKCGWKKDQTWGREVRLPEPFNRKWVGMGKQKTIRQWQIMGVKDIKGAPLPENFNLKASLIQPQGAGGPVYLVYPNYRTLLKWNRSHLFGLAVGILSDRLAADPAQTQSQN